MKFEIPEKDSLVNISLIATNIEKYNLNDSIFIIPDSVKIFDSRNFKNELLQEFNKEDGKLKQSVERIQMEQLKSDSPTPPPPFKKSSNLTKKKVNTKKKK